MTWRPFWRKGTLFYVHPCCSLTHTRGAKLLVSRHNHPLSTSVECGMSMVLFTADREAVERLDAKIRSERTTCGETVSIQATFPN